MKTNNNKYNYIEAFDITTNVIAKANAGSGKTTVLIGRILSLLLNEEPIQSIIIITYTNSAAEEIRSRVMSKTKRWSEIVTEELKEELILIGQEASQKKLEIARSLWKTFIWSNETIWLGTMHSFCQKIATTSDDGTGPEINNLLKQNKIIQNITKEIVSQLIYEESGDIDNGFGIEGIGKRVTQEFLKTIVIHSTGFIEQIVKTIVANRDTLLRDFRPQAIVHNFEDMFDLIDRDLEKEILSVITIERLKSFQVLLNKEYTSFIQAKKGAGSIQKKIKELELLITNLPIKPNQTLLLKDFFTTDEGTIRSITTSKTISQSIIDEFKFMAERIIEFTINQNNLRVLSSSFIVSTIAHQVVKRYSELMSEGNLIDYQGILEKTRDMLDSNKDDALKYQLSKKIKHILIDEAQDISPISWDIIISIIDTMFATKNKTTNQSIFIVGDEKQSIFSFQGADVNNFTDVINQLSKKIKKFDLKLVKPSLTKSYRTNATILDIIDEVFNKEKNRQSITRDHFIKHHSAVTEKENETGVFLVEIQKENKARESGTSTDWKLVTSNTADRNISSIITHIVNIVKHEIKKGTNQRDIMILVRNRNAKNNATIDLVKSLIENGITCNLDKFRLETHILFHDFVSLTKFLHSPELDINLVAVLSGIFFQVPLQQIQEVCLNRGGKTIFEYINIHYSTISEKLKQLLSIYVKDGIAACLIFLLYKKQYMKKIEEEFGINGKSIAIKVVSLAINAKSGPFDVPSLLKEISINETNIESRQNNGITITTPHSAKGMEARVVIMCDLVTSSYGPSISKINSVINYNGALLLLEDVKLLDNRFLEAVNKAKQNAIDEENRVLYVSMTRAMDRLYIVGEVSDKINWLNIIKQSEKVKRFALDNLESM